MPITWEGLDDLDRRLEALERVGTDPDAALERAAERLRSEVTPGVPVVTGRLRRSGRVDGPRLIWDDLHYAVPVQRRRHFFQPVVEARGPAIIEEELEIAMEEALNG